MVDEIIVMMAPGHLDAVRGHRRAAAATTRSAGDRSRAATTRNETTLRALDALGDDECNVLFHDAVRPLLTPRIITECFEALEAYHAVDVAIPSADTIIEVGPRQHHPRHPAARGAAPRPDAAGVPVLGASGARTSSPTRTRTSTATDDCTVVLRYLPDVPIWVVRGDERNMKVTDPIDVYLADKLFQLAHTEPPERGTEDDYRAALAGRRWWSSAAATASAPTSAALAEQYGARVFSFSRSSHRHPRRAPRPTSAGRAEQVLAETGRIDFVVNTAGVLPRGTLAETSEETIYAATEVNYLAPVFIAQVVPPAPRGDRRLAAAVHVQLLHPRPQRLQPLLLGEGRDRQPDPGAGRRVGGRRRPGQLHQPRADRAPRCGRRAFGEEPADSLLESEAVARTSLDVLVSDLTGHVIDVRREIPARLTAPAWPVRTRSSGTERTRTTLDRVALRAIFGKA